MSVTLLVSWLPASLSGNYFRHLLYLRFVWGFWAIILRKMQNNRPPLPPLPALPCMDFVSSQKWMDEEYPTQWQDRAAAFGGARGTQSTNRGWGTGGWDPAMAERGAGGAGDRAGGV